MKAILLNMHFDAVSNSEFISHELHIVASMLILKCNV